ncbi:DUF6383 domain-containing protein [Parabacteroides sp. AF17-28]|uniref:DUF6383 domain-containing protein n=1 Tax=Parabacteroides sp. AF17-28 TaxID=2292241 RepID=UPI000EFDCF68|nr:DUF6383 domain-containing protein [Parabacteroides sp. AF17-28]RHR56898.1 hypothetical protein DWW90_12155 [Parabacteroides sp. AF17-28]
MNKKFSTLLAGVALLGAMNANATTPVTSLQKTNDGLYQLEFEAAGGTKSYLSMSESGALYLEGTVKADNLAKSLWCVEVTEEGFGKAPIFDFTNKATGQRLDIQFAGTLLEGLAVGAAATTSPDADSTRVGGEVSGWAFSTQYTANLQAKRTLYSYFKADSVIGLVKDAAGDKILVKKMGASEAYADAEDAAGTALTKFTLVEADVIRLGANEINTYLGMQAADKGVALKFSPDEQGEKVAVANPFNGKNAGKFLAEGVPSENDYVFVLTTDSSYLRVDTSIVNASGERFRAFKWSDLSYAKRQASTAATKPTSAADSIRKVTGLADQYKFAFSYYPSKDSLVIQVKSAMDYDPATATNGSNWVADAAATVLPTAAGVKGENNFVTVQDLIQDKVRIVTIYDKKETDITLGFKGCEAGYNGRTSIADGLYFIMNQKGQYLASPIHKNGTSLEWVTVKADEQLPAHMPAYQWVVLKKNTGDKVKAYSPVNVTNREYPTQTTLSQLMQAEGAKYMTASDALYQGVDSLVFVQVKDAEGVKDNAALIAEAYQDTLLGYKNIKDAKFFLDEYTFKYLHPYATGENSKYLAKGAGKDSLLNVLNGKDAFRLVEKKWANYGYAGTAAELKRAGIKKLYRVSYSIQLKDAFMGEAAEAKYAMSKYFGAPADSFFFKENNHYEGECFYAIVKADDETIGDYKAGVTDDILDATVKVQPLGETRTSAFAINPDNTPLYRRFNNVNLGESATDGRDSLRFFENVRKEYLMDENNREGGLMDANVSYAGMWTADKATGLAFQIDTAWVGRGRGYIKPQYLISVNHNDFEGVEGTPCTEDGPHITPDGQITDDPMLCKHAHPAIPGFERAKYLVSFQDSVDVYGQDKPYADIAGGYTRVGFVEGIRVADTLWILPAEYRSVANDKIDFKALEKADSTLFADEGVHIKNLLSQDNHKNYTWSFRYVHPENAANVTAEGKENSFLFESNNYDGENIAPENAAWLKIQNGCVVLTKDPSLFSNAKTGGDGALVFNVENKENDELATDNETIATSEVTVIAQNGAVRIANAEGKKVVITNILGQTVANTVITSSDAVIAAPAGVVVVAVEGEEAVKAIVK